jgi:hypothetical protein
MNAHAARDIDHSRILVAAPATGQVLLRSVAAPTAGTIMHPHVYRIAFGCWFVFLSLFWMTFWVSANALFMVVIGTFYAAMFFGVPYVMIRQVPGRSKAKGPLLTFLETPFATNSGTIHGYETLLQVILVPLCLIAGGTAISIVIRLSRAAH